MQTEYCKKIDAFQNIQNIHKNHESVLDAKMYSRNPDDFYLMKVIRKVKNKFVIHLYNAYDNGFSNGVYFLTYTEALKYFNEV